MRSASSTIFMDRLTVVGHKIKTVLNILYTSGLVIIASRLRKEEIVTVDIIHVKQN